MARLCAGWASFSCHGYINRYDNPLVLVLEQDYGLHQECLATKEQQLLSRCSVQMQYTIFGAEGLRVFF